ncbi:MAG: c-type cytochrome [Candidatus Eisenbacteria bacterium]|nr:c-type cytochrome [Candidatus Eisenbacteria bacterium]
MKIVRFLAIVAGGLLALILVAAAALMLNGWILVHRTPANRARAVALRPDSTLLARGEHLARSSCAGCHSPNLQLPLSGSTADFLAEPGMPPFGHLHAPNLTPGGVLARYSDAELARAIREGVNREGRPMLVMPSVRFHNLSDRDVAALIAYLRSQPAVSRAVPPRVLSPLAYLVLGAKLFPLAVTPEAPATQDGPAEAVTPEYGEYVAGYLACQDCHGEDLRGAPEGQMAPKGPDLVGLASAHSLTGFDGAMRRGLSPVDGRSLDPLRMPYPVFAHASDIEVAAIYALLRAGGIRPQRKP